MGRKYDYSILIVDDEPMLLKMLKKYLESEKFIVYTAENAKDAMEKLHKELDIILLDISMPEIDGIEFCQKIRNEVTCPIVFVTARSTQEDKVRGFMCGGDDYVVKPFNINELIMRIRAHIRRDERVSRRTRVRCTQGLFINYDERSIRFDGESITLTNKEFEIIKLLSMNPGQVFDKETIYEKIWGFEGKGDNMVVKEHIRRIRNKLIAYTDVQFIKTVWGVGYKWEKS